jgi:hypothetical protein
MLNRIIALPLGPNPTGHPSSNVPPCVPKNPVCRKPNYALHHNNVNTCRKASILSEDAFHTSALLCTSLHLRTRSTALTIPCFVVNVRNSQSSARLGLAAQMMHPGMAVLGYRQIYQECIPGVATLSQHCLRVYRVEHLDRQARDLLRARTKTLRRD